jgi:hypothetical protein
VTRLLTVVLRQVTRLLTVVWPVFQLDENKLSNKTSCRLTLKQGVVMYGCCDCHEKKGR